MKRLHYEIKGMSCAVCVGHVERAIKKVLGERDTVTVSLLTNSVSILLSDGEVSPEEIKRIEARLVESVKAAGYTLLLPEEHPSKNVDKKHKKSVLRLCFSALFTLLVTYLSMGKMMGLPLPLFLSGTENALPSALLQLVLTVPVLVLNFHFFKNGFSALLHGAPNMDSMIAVGAGAAMIYGIAAVVILLTEGEHSALSYEIHHDLYFESAAMILTLVSLGKWLEGSAKDRATAAISSLSTLSPKFATVIREGKEVSVAVSQLRVGELLLIRAGELIPVDGVVISGCGSADESALTGESMPVEKSEGVPVCAACVLVDGALTVRAERVGEDTSLSRIIRLLEDTAASKAPISRLADKVSAIFVPCVMGISLVTLVVWLIATRNASQALRCAISVLVISCPCALGLATPTAITVGIGRAAQRGILFRSAAAMEKLCSVRCAIFDKTGTITEGNPSLTDVVSYGISTQELLLGAASVERFSAHPLALAICRGAERLKIFTVPVTDFSILASVGAQGTINGEIWRIGKPSPSFRISHGKCSQEKKSFDVTSQKEGIHLCERTDFFGTADDLERLEKEGKTAVLVEKNGEVVGVLGISDRLRPEATNTINALRSVGVNCWMLTGDHERVASFVAKKANFDGFYASLMPEDKERIVKEIAQKKACAMIGDGINDTPAMVRADVGIAVGGGTEVAIDCAEVVLSGNSLFGVVEAFSISRATLRIIRQNLFWALFYNAVCIPVAAGVFYPTLGIGLSPMLASAAMSCSSIFVVLNALRLRHVPLEKTKNKRPKKENVNMSKTVSYTVTVEGMMCPRCAAHVKEALVSLCGVECAEVNLEKKRVTVTADASVTLDAIKEAIVAAGYEVV